MMDICDGAAVDAIIARLQPTHLIHLAAISNVALSLKEPLLTWNTNVIGTLNLMESLKSHAPDCFTLFVSSSEVYGETFKRGQPLDEPAPLCGDDPLRTEQIGSRTCRHAMFSSRPGRGDRAPVQPYRPWPERRLCHGVIRQADRVD